jgi:hypothetical protein
MKKIFRLTDNPFDDREIISSRLAAFGHDAATRLVTEFPQESRTVADAATLLTQKQSTVLNSSAAKESGTGSVDAFLASAAEFMRRSVARVSVDLGEDSTAFKAIYPNGVQTYTRVTKTEAPAVFKALKDTMESIGGELHAPTRERMTRLSDEWLRAKQAQDSAEGALADNRDLRDNDREQLEWALYDALLCVTRHYQKTPERVQSFFDHTLLNTPRHASLERPATEA